MRQWFFTVACGGVTLAVCAGCGGSEPSSAVAQVGVAHEATAPSADDPGSPAPSQAEWQPLGETDVPEAVGQNLRSLFTGLATYHAMERVGPDGSAVVGSFPPDQLRAPATVPCQAVSYDFTQHETLRDLGFSIAEPQPYAYELLIDRDAGTWVARAYADSDCDGTPTGYEMRGATADDGMLYREPDPEFWVLNPGE